MSSIRPHGQTPLTPHKTERRIASRAASFSDPLSEADHNHTRRSDASRKGMRLSLIVLSCGAVCAFGFGLLLELLG